MHSLHLCWNSSIACAVSCNTPLAHTYPAGQHSLYLRRQHDRSDKLCIRAVNGDSDSSKPGPSLTDPVQTLAWGGTLPSSRRAFFSVVSGTAIALGGNLGGVTSGLLSLDGGQLAASTRLDVLVPVNGFKRCVDYGQNFEFTYPAAWLADQTLLYRAAARAEEERRLDPPALTRRATRTRSGVVEPTAAFGPPGSTGETNVSIIVAPIYVGFSLATMGQPQQFATRFLSNIAPEGSGLEAKLLGASSRMEEATGQLYYTFEYTVQRGTAFFRHNMSVITSRDDLLYTFNAQTPETSWAPLAADMQRAAASFHLLPPAPAKQRFPTRL